MAGSYYNDRQFSQQPRHGVRQTDTPSQQVNYDRRGEPMATDTPATLQSCIPDLSKTQDLLKMLKEVTLLVDKSEQELTDATRKLTEVAQERCTVRKTKADDSNDKITQLENEIEELKKRLNEKDQEIIEKKQTSQARYAKLKEEAKGIIQSLEEKVSVHEQAIDELNTERTNHKRDIDQLSRSNEKSNERLEIVRKEKRDVEAELNATKTRLSKIMGNKLSDNNPDIADLSDMNRPTKIAEKFSELYDNEWTDAYEEVEKLYTDEKRSITFLLEILKLAMEHCDEMGAEHSKHILQALCFTRDGAAMHHGDFQADAKKQVKDFRKSAALMSMQQVQNRFQENMKNKRNVSYDVSKLFESKKMQDFMNKCVEICWLMSVQDPPLTFGFDVQENELFDKNRFKPYTRTGAYIEYLVWPEMFLKEDARLCKGVAQCALRAQSARERHRHNKNQTSDSRPQTAPPTRVSRGYTEERSHNYDQGSADSTEPQNVDYLFQQRALSRSTTLDQNADTFKSPRAHTNKSEPPSPQHTNTVKLTTEDLRSNCPKHVSKVTWDNFLSMVKVYGIQAWMSIRFKTCIEHYKKLTSVQSDV